MTAALVAFFGTGGALYYYQRRQYRAKRRARRGKDGQRREVVVIAGDLRGGVTKSLITDLERRLFIVYVLASSAQEEDQIKKLGKKDILSLHLNITDPHDVKSSLDNFASTLAQEKRDLHLAGLIVVPDTAYTHAPIETLHPELWSDTLNTRVIQTVALIQAFMRLLVAQNARLLLLTPTIPSSLSLPFHALESSAASALEAYTATLRNETRKLGVEVCNIRLGHFNLEGQDKTALMRNASSDALSWPREVKDSYGEAYMAFSDAATGSKGVRGSPLRELHNAVFDALDSNSRLRGVVSVGRGSRMYPFVGRWVPSGLVAWMMGFR